MCIRDRFTRGTEHDLDTPGLQLIDGEVSRLDADVVPHIGWDTVDAPEGSVLLNGVEGERFYFVHSYAAFTAAPADLTQFDIDLGDAEQKVAFCDYSRSHFVASYEPVSYTHLEDRPVFVQLPAHALDMQRLEQFSQILSNHPGACEVRLAIVDDNGGVTLMTLGDRFRVRRETGLFADIKVLFGANALPII